MDDLRLVGRCVTKTDQLDSRTIELQALIDTLYEAGQDDRIQGILLDCKYGATTENTELADLEELHRALRDIQKTPSKVNNKIPSTAVASLHKDIPGLRTLYLTGAASTSRVHPRAKVAAHGLEQERFFGKRMLEQNGVKAAVF